jgi:hypothetical protein
VVQVLKQRMSRQMRGRKRKRSVAQLELWNGDGPWHFWQRRFYDFEEAETV